jgi:predicted dithiol-disulfide oxidoreductase (DUF899 family)
MATKKRAASSLHQTRFPGEKAAYRSARDKLLRAELKLRRDIESVSAMRRKLPLGGALKEDYAFDGGDGRVRMSELFAEGKDTLLVYSFMFGPQMKSACSSCTSILDGLNGQAPHVTQRVNMAVVANHPSSGSRSSRTAAAGPTCGYCRPAAIPTIRITTGRPTTVPRSRR